MLRRDEFAVLDELRKTGPLPLELEQRHQKLRRQEFYKAGLVCDRYPPPSDSRLVPADMTIADWLRAKWVGADTVVRNALQALAERIGVPIPMSRTRIHQVPAQDSPQARRTKFARQPYVEQDTLPSLTERKQRGYHDPPEWDDDDADGWQPCTSLHDALYPPKDRGWY